MANAGFNLALAIRVAYLAGQRGYSVVRQNVAIEWILAWIVDVRRQYAFTQVVRDRDPRRAAQPPKCLLVQLGRIHSSNPILPLAIDLC